MPTNSKEERHRHWEGVYRDRSPTVVSWYQIRPDISLELIHATGKSPDATIVDVGGGASTLVDHLLDAGWSSVLVLDISETALAHVRERLGARAKRVTWIAADVTAWRPNTKIDIWHDRAVLHFFTGADDQKAYAERAKLALRHGGWAIIAGFTPGGPRKCSGLDIVQHDAHSLRALLGDAFELVDFRDELHRTPSGSTQAFRYHLFRRG
jgi:SAM-dependent methyltransferase